MTPARRTQVEAQAKPVGRHDEDVKRAILPEIMLPEDVQRALGLKSKDEARDMMIDGDVGPRVLLASRVYVRRESFLAHLKSLEETP